jgi:hypothetical protein
VSAVVPVVIAVVALVMIFASRKGISANFSVRTKIQSPEQMEKLLENPTVAAKLREAGLDPAALEADIRSGNATFADGRLRVTKTIKTASVHLDPNAPLPPDAHPLTAQEASVFTQSPEFVEQLRKSGVDPEQFKRDVAAGKVMGTSHTYAPGAPDAAPPAPPAEQLAPPSDDGDKVWKSGEL